MKTQGQGFHHAARSAGSRNLFEHGYWRRIFFVLMALGLAGLVIWDVFFTPGPPDPDNVSLVSSAPLVTSPLALTVDLAALNTSSASSVYFYVWNNGIMAGRWIDQASVKGRAYRVRARLARDGVILFDDYYGVQLERAFTTGPLAIGVAFESQMDGTQCREAYEARYDLWVGPGDISMTRNPRMAVYQAGAWQDVPPGRALIAGAAEPIEAPGWAGWMARVAFAEEVERNALRHVLRELAGNHADAPINLTAIHHEKLFSADPEELAREYEIRAPTPDNTWASGVLRDAGTFELHLGEKLGIPAAHCQIAPVGTGTPIQRQLLVISCNQEMPMDTIERHVETAARGTAFRDILLWPLPAGSVIERAPNTILCAILAPVAKGMDEQLRLFQRKIAAGIKQG